MPQQLPFGLPLLMQNGAATAVATTGNDNDATVTFTKVEKALNVQTVDRDDESKGTPVTLFDKEVANTINPPPPNSVRLTGQVVFEFALNVFTLTARR